MGKLRIAAALLPAACLAAAVWTSPVFAASEKAATPKRELTPGQIAAHDRQTKYAAEWHAAKDAGKIPDGMTWPKFWHDCNTRLKAQ